MAPHHPKKKAPSRLRSLKRLGQDRITRLRLSMASKKNESTQQITVTAEKADDLMQSPVTSSFEPHVARKLRFAHPKSQTSGAAQGNTTTAATHADAAPLSPVTAGSNPQVARRSLFAHPNNSQVGDSRGPTEVVANVPVEISFQTPPPLFVEARSQVEENKREVTGRRIVDFNYIFDQLVAADINHDRTFSCTLQNMKIIKEQRDGLRCKFLIECNVCRASSTIESEPEAGETNMGINQIVAATAISIGVGHRQMEEIMGAFDIPFMTFSKFKKCEDEVGDTLHSVALTAMKEAADEEACLAREMNEVDSNGVPLITVVADGSWAKRSYRTKYDSLSGMAAIMGCRTGKVLYIGVRNKFCVTCAKAETKGATPKPHDCYKNWSGTSSGMEASVIVNGFKTSMEYGLIYNKLVADGDSSVYNQILKSRPYRDVGVEKLECFNHLLRNYCRNLRDLGKNRHAGPKVLRDVIIGKVKKLRSAVNQASISFGGVPTIFC